MDPSSESSPQSKRHSFPAILTYSETLSVLSEHQRQYNDKQIIRRSRMPTFNSKASDEERWQRLQQAMEWLREELKDMYHQDKFLLRQFSHLNRSIQDLKEEQQTMEETERQLKQEKAKKDQVKQEKAKKDQVKQKHVKQEHVKQKQLKQEQMKQEKLKQEQAKQEHVKQELSLKEEKLNQERRSLNEYDSDYGSDQSMDKFEDCQPVKNEVISRENPKTTQKHPMIKRWTWWK